MKFADLFFEAVSQELTQDELTHLSQKLEIIYQEPVANYSGLADFQLFPVKLYACLKNTEMV